METCQKKNHQDLDVNVKKNTFIFNSGGTRSNTQWTEVAVSPYPPIATHPTVNTPFTTFVYISHCI